MPIKFRCPNVTCGKALTVSDQAAGRAGKCPACGGILIVPSADAAAGEGAYELAPESESMAPSAHPAAHAQADPRFAVNAGRQPSSADAPWTGQAAPSRPADEFDWIVVDAPTAGGPAVSFDAIGIAWRLLKSRMGTWVLALLVAGAVVCCCQLGLGVVSSVTTALESMVIRSPVPISVLGVFAAGLMVQAVIQGGLCKMALKQIDGEEIGVGDLFSIGRAAPALAVAGLLTMLGMYLGLALLVIPGLIFAGLVMFTTPAIVEGLGALEAVTQSIRTLKRQWLLAPLFAIVASLLSISGVVLCGIGILLTAPIGVLAVAVQYRRSFAPGGIPRKAIVADPSAEALGKPFVANGNGRVPAWAWALIGFVVVIPVVLVSVAVAIVVPTALRAARQAADQARMREQMARFPAAMKNQGGFPEGAVPPAFAPPDGFVVAPNPAPLDPVQRALALAQNGGNRRGEGVRLLAVLPPDARYRAAVLAAAAPLLRDRFLEVDAAQALARWAGADDAMSLVAGLNSRNTRVRSYLIQALGRLRAEVAIPTLVQHLAEPKDRGDASRALLAIGPAAAPDIRTLLTSNDPDTRNAAASLLRALGSFDRGTNLSLWLAALKSGNRFEIDRALGNLSRTSPNGDVRAELLSAVVPLLGDPQPSTRRLAVKVIESWGGVEQVSALAEALNDDDRIVRTTAVGALRRLGGPDAALALARALDSPDVRRDAANGLIAMKPDEPEVEVEVLKALESPEWQTRQAACQVLRVIGTPSSVPALTKASGDERASVAMAARAALDAINPFAMPGAKGTSRKKR